MKEIEEKNRQKDIPLSSDRKINIVKMTVLPKSNLQIQCNPYAITNGNFSQNQKKKALKFEWRHKRPKIDKAILRKKNGAGVMHSLTSDYTTKLLTLKKKKKGTHYDIKT